MQAICSTCGGQKEKAEAKRANAGLAGYNIGQQNIIKKQ
jgi:hypothetical protein